MQLRLYSEDDIRLETAGTFIDVSHIGYETLAVDLYSFQGYIEIRKKETHFRVFQFPKKSYKKECDFGYWEDAEVVYSYNRNGKDSDQPSPETE